MQMYEIWSTQNSQTRITSVISMLSDPLSVATAGKNILFCFVFKLKSNYVCLHVKSVRDFFLLQEYCIQHYSVEFFSN